MKTRLFSAMMMCVIMLGALAITGCTQAVPQGHVGRIQSSSGWNKEVLPPGRHTCWGRDKLFLLETTNQAFTENLNVLVGGKVNLKMDYSVRVRANTNDEEMLRQAFEQVIADQNGTITIQQLYTTFLKMKVQAVPRQIYEIQPDIATAIASNPELATQARKQLTEMAASTPMIVGDMEFTNYDWPPSITDAQNKLAAVQLNEAAAEAEVRADLKRAEGQLKVEEANKLVELKRAEAVAESIEVIRTKLAGAPEYLMWHQIRVMGQAAMGPNNCFILYPFATDPGQIKQMIGNANLSQLLRPEGPNPELREKMSQNPADYNMPEMFKSDIDMSSNKLDELSEVIPETKVLDTPSQP